MTPSANPTTITVVVPTFNRVDRLHRVLSALAHQTASANMDVIVVSDGSTDGTDDYLRSRRTPLPVTALFQSNAGPAAARNAGILASDSKIVLFVDDDVIPASDLVERHLETHRKADRDAVVIGPMLTPEDATLSPWVAWEQYQLHKQYDGLADGTLVCSFRQFYTGNASVPRDRLIAVGLFNTDLRRAEDVELAFRLHEDGVPFCFAPDARGYHYAERTFESWLATAYEYGRTDVTFINTGQEWLAVTLPQWFRNRHFLVRSLTRLCVPRPRVADATTAALRAFVLSPVSVEPLRRQALSGLYNMTYYRGVAEELGSGLQFMRFIRGQDAPPLAVTRNL